MWCCGCVAGNGAMKTKPLGCSQWQPPRCVHTELDRSTLWKGSDRIGEHVCFLRFFVFQANFGPSFGHRISDLQEVPNPLFHCFLRFATPLKLACENARAVLDPPGCLWLCSWMCLWLWLWLCVCGCVFVCLWLCVCGCVLCVCLWLCVCDCVFVVVFVAVCLWLCL